MIPAPPAGAVRFNPPPGWAVPAGFDPARGHLVDPTWPPAPEGWAFWVPETTTGSAGATLPTSGRARGKLHPADRKRTKITVGVIVAVVVAIIGFNVLGPHSPSGKDVGACWSGGSNRVHSVSCGSSEAAFVVLEKVTTPDACPAEADSYVEAGDDILCMRAKG